MYYAIYYVEDNTSDITSTWEECQEKTKGKKTRFQKFKTKKEAKAWLDSGAEYEDKKEKIEKEKETLDKDAVYFDAGTGRGNGVEVRISTVNGKSLLGFVLPNEKINEFGNYYLDKNRTNNFGELTALFAALKYALEYGIKKIAGDSQLIIEYWSLGRYSEDVDQDTVNLIKRVVKMREEFEKKGGVIKKISGDINPADLGFHK